jgi:hypothetical protein
MKKKIQTNDEMRRKGIPYKKRMFILSTPKLLDEWLENLKIYAEQDAPIVENLRGFELEEYYFLFFDILMEKPKITDDAILFIQEEIKNYEHSRETKQDIPSSTTP